MALRTSWCVLEDSVSVTDNKTSMKVPFFRPSIGAEEKAAVMSVMESGWLTTGQAVKRFEQSFAEAVGAKHAIALNSATAALHLAVEALGLRPGQGVLVPTHTFAATAEVVRYLNAVPVLVDCDPESLFIDLTDAEEKLAAARTGTLLAGLEPLDVVGIMPVHVGGVMGDMTAVARFAAAHGLWVVEDAAHSFPAAFRSGADEPWVCCGQGTAAVTCFSFYANKTITTGEGGMAVTEDDELAARIRLMSLHGLSRDAWDRYTGGGTWDYRIIAPGFKYNLTDVAAAIGNAQLAKAESMRVERQQLAAEYFRRLAAIDEIELPADPADRIHAWHLFPIRLRLDRLTIDRAEFIEQLKAHGITTSVHWRPLHLHPYYQDEFGWTAAQLPMSTREWPRLISLPLFPGMTAAELTHVITSVAAICQLARAGAGVGA
jgi:dTDP-4-amino-4,6-dideoxygalactose transaminase